VTFPGTVFSTSFSNEERIRDIATARARLGWTYNCWLWYVTAGGAWAKIDSDYNRFSPFTALPLSASFSTTRSGWTVGGGVETQFAGNWSAKLEYLYVDLGTLTNSVTVNPFDRVFVTATESTKIHENIVRVGLNYRFGGGGY
jgi:outer membrane immunogenic protein